MKTFIITIMIIILFSTSILFAQSTGYSDNFNGDLQVSGPPSFSFEQEDGLLHISVNKEPKKWQAITYSINDTINISSQPIINIKLKTSTGFLLTAYVVDADNKNYPINMKINATNTFVNYCIDFSSAKNIDLEHITEIFLTPNGNVYGGLKSEIYIDELKLGTDAEMLAGINGVQESLAFVNSINNRISIFDLKNSDNIVVTDGESSITNINITDIADNMVVMTYDCQTDYIGNDTLTITAIGSLGYSDNSILVPLEIHGNYSPSLDSISNMDVVIGDTINILLQGIHDGNSAVEQPLLISAASNNQVALPDSNIYIDYNEGESTAKVSFLPIQAATDIEISINLDDQYASDNIKVTTFIVNAYAQYNTAPFINLVDDKFAYLNDGQQIFNFTGIGDGDNSSQNLTITAQSSQQRVISDEGITINYIQGNSTAEFQYTPLDTGITNITLIITDDGGTDSNNGNAQIQIDFNIEIGLMPLTGYTLPMSEFIAQKIDPKSSLVAGDWNVEGLGEAQIIDFGSFHGKDNVIKSTLVNKTCWAGLWVGIPELDVDNHRYLSYDIYFEGGDFAGSSGQTHCYFWDEGWDGNLNRNIDEAHAKRKTVNEGQWKTVVMDFRSAGGMNNNNSVELNVKRIQKILINYASHFSWPFPINNGTVYLTNIKLGSDVPDSLLPVITPTCTIDPIADQSLFSNSGLQTIELTNISNGNDLNITPTITAVSSDTSFIPHPIVSSINIDGTGELKYESSDGIGESEITLTVSADGSNDKVITFKILILDNNIEDAINVKLYPGDHNQTIRGFGTFQFENKPNYFDFYTENLGASAVRIGLIGNQIEPENDNNDPNILDMTALNYDAFNFDYYKRLKEAGVQTFILTSWSPPAWMKRNLSVAYGYAAAPNYEDTDNILEPYYYEEFAESMVAVVKMFKARAGIDLYAISPQNEPAFCEPYGSAVFNPVELAKLCGVIGEKFNREGITTKLFMPEQVFSQHHYPVTDYINAIKSNSIADQYTEIIATHSYEKDGVNEANPTFDGWVDIWNFSQRCNYNKELWMTESSPKNTGWNSALGLAVSIHGALAYGNISLWTLWNFEGIYAENGIVNSSFYIAKNYYKYIRPGAVRFDATSEHQDIMVSSFVHEDDRTVTTVIINKGDSPKSVNVIGATIDGAWDIYTSAENIDFEFMGSELPGSPIVLPKESVTTLIGHYDSLETHIEEEQIPQGFKLYQNYPNPFNPTTTIEYSLGKMSNVEIKIYNLLGQKIHTLVKSKQNMGVYRYTFDAGNFASGVYFYRLKTEHYTTVKKMLLLK